MRTEAAFGNLLWARRLAVALGLYALAGGVISFCGWAFDVQRLTDWVGEDVSIQPNAAVLITMAGAAVLLRQFGFRTLPMFLGGVVATAGAINLLQFIVRADFGFSHQLLFGREWGHGSTITPGRVGPPASLSFVLIGSGIVFLSLRASWSNRLGRFVPAMALTVALLMSFSIMGYLFGARNFYSIPSLSSIAPQTSTMLLALAAALIVSVPDRQPMLLLCERSSAGTMARTVLPILVVMTPAIIWLRGKGYERNLYDLGTSRALGGVAMVLGTVALMWTALLALRRRELLEREADRRKDEFLATLAHELRNPLAPLRNALTILKVAPDDADARLRAREMMERQVNQMVRLIDDLLDVSRISRGKLELRPERVELAQIVSNAVETCRSLAEEAAHRLNVALPSGKIVLHADPVRLSQVFCNLLHNACKFTERGGQIDLIAEVQGREAIVTVKDTGIGIPRDKLDSIFEMFSQIDRTLEKSHGGLGIGLTLVKRLVELHGGVIEAHSDGIGKGSEFIVRLPIVSGATPIVSPPPVEESKPATRRILVVDDNRDSAESLAMLLQMSKIETHTAYDGQEAVAAATELRPDVILLDLGLPKLNGYAACRSIRQSPWGKEAIIIAMTGWGQEEDKRKTREAGFDAHLVKPVDNAELMRLLAMLPGGANQQ